MQTKQNIHWRSTGRRAIRCSVIVLWNTPCFFYFYCIFSYLFLNKAKVTPFAGSYELPPPQCKVQARLLVLFSACKRQDRLHPHKRHKLYKTRTSSARQLAIIISRYTVQQLPLFIESKCLCLVISSIWQGSSPYHQPAVKSHWYSREQVTQLQKIAILEGFCCWLVLWVFSFLKSEGSKVTTA